MHVIALRLLDVVIWHRMMLLILLCISIFMTVSLVKVNM